MTKNYVGVVQVLKGIDLNVEAGDSVRYFGPNWAGKSITIAGKVRMFGYDTDKDIANAVC